jgi:hypothetical protein
LLSLVSSSSSARSWYGLWSLFIAEEVKKQLVVAVSILAGLMALFSKFFCSQEEEEQGVFTDLTNAVTSSG